MRKQQPHRYLISGGGTGGHIFPAIAIAEAIREKEPEARFLFVGAKGRMEMSKVPHAGYPITGLNITGIARSLSAKNLLFPFRLVGSLIKALKIIRQFKPDITIGTGGYASGPTLYAAALKRIPILIQEQNAYPGITNRTLGKRADRICVAYDKMEQFFPKEKIVQTGNPIRKQLQTPHGDKREALQFFEFTEALPTILIVGGSQGSLAINRAIMAILKEERLQANILWQTGSRGYDEAVKATEKLQNERIKIHQFITRMDLAYGAADIIISRAGAIAISEMAVAGKCTLFIPLPSAAADHQYKNARYLQEKGAAICIPQKEMMERLLPTITQLLNNPQKVSEIAQHIRSMGQPHAATAIADEVFHLIATKR
ncbi:MAG: undecaprenyldiphospho-muramoylpentapeptide beta-N-acetylglucosaminyltransferase [Bacteroidetes bacterium]|nr:MAG: undecaprenyldiphospho-muramoylpentapeptide beta-N-acetylglucosaminyltransferase [Bacteroidota bacterium]